MTGISINALSEEKGIERRELKKALMREGVPFTRDGKAYLFDEDAARKVASALAERRDQRTKSAVGSSSPMHRYYTAKAEQTELANEEKKRQLSRDWVKVEDVDDMLRMLTDALDRSPGKWRSEHGLSDRIVSAIQRDIDTARKDAAAKIRK